MEHLFLGHPEGLVFQRELTPRIVTAPGERSFPAHPWGSSVAPASPVQAQPPCLASGLALSPGPRRAVVGGGAQSQGGSLWPC